MKNSLCDSGEDLKKILDDHMVTKKFNDSVRSSKEEDLINSGMAFLKNDQKVKNGQKVFSISSQKFYSDWISGAGL